MTRKGGEHEEEYDEGKNEDDEDEEDSVDEDPRSHLMRIWIWTRRRMRR